jgi:glyoxylase-like metal-dependent hydrolase (beta-lactamase superfamily II)
MPTLDVLLHGTSIRTDKGIAAFCSVVLVEGRTRTLVDYGHVGRRNALIKALADRGLTPGDIDQTVVTHAHWDHVQNFDLWLDKPLLIHPDERRYAQVPHRNDWATPAWTGAMLEIHPDIVEVDEGYEIEPGVRIMATPGHTAGSNCVVVDTPDGTAVITGDVLHSASIALKGQCSAIFWNEAQARDSIARIMATADVIYPGHDRPFRIVDGKPQHLAELELEVSGLDPTSPLIRFTNPTREEWVMPGIEDQVPERLPA